MHNVLLIIKHEIATTLGKRSFWLMTFLFPALIVGLSAGTQLLAEKSIEESQEEFAPGSEVADTQVIGYVDEAGLIVQWPEGIPPAMFRAYPDRAAAQAALETGVLRRYFLIPANFVETGEVVLIDSDFMPFRSFEGGGGAGVFEYVVQYNLVGDEGLTTVLLNPTPSVMGKKLAPEKDTTEGANLSGSMSFWVPYATMFIFFFVITMSSGFMLQSVTKEKENRVVEILLLSLRPRELMLGKVVGLGVAALLQMGIWAGVALLGLNQRLDLLDVMGTFTLPPGFLIWGVLYFLLGYLLYASALGAIGALAPTAREGTQFTFIALLPLMVPLWLNTVFSQTPHGGLATFLSLFPLTAPTSMVTRLVTGGVPLWQPVVSLLGLAATTYLLVLLSARLFRADTLLSSAGLHWRRFVEEFRR
ncbi:MAG: ABC transporter permease [Chloroflexota bacterium]